VKAKRQYFAKKRAIERKMTCGGWFFRFLIAVFAALAQRMSVCLGKDNLSCT